MNRKTNIRTVNGISATLHSNLHKSLKVKYGKASRCENDSCGGRSNNFEWALKKGHTYSDNKEDYFQLCASCHRKYDFTEKTREKLSEIGRKNMERNNPMNSKAARDKIAKCMSERIIAKESIDKISKKVIDTKTGIIYSSIREASDKTGINNKTLSSILTGHRKNNTALMYFNPSQTL